MNVTLNAVADLHIARCQISKQLNINDTQQLTCCEQELPLGRDGPACTPSIESPEANMHAVSVYYNYKNLFTCFST